MIRGPSNISNIGPNSSKTQYSKPSSTPAHCLYVDASTQTAFTGGSQGPSLINSISNTPFLSVPQGSHSTNPTSQSIVPVETQASCCSQKRSNDSSGLETVLSSNQQITRLNPMNQCLSVISNESTAQPINNSVSEPNTQSKSLCPSTSENHSQNSSAIQSSTSKSKRQPDKSNQVTKSKSTVPFRVRDLVMI